MTSHRVITASFSFTITHKYNYDTASRAAQSNSVYVSVLGSMYFSGKLPTYPSTNRTLTLTSRFGKNRRFCEGLIGSFSKSNGVSTMLTARANPFPTIYISSFFSCEFWRAFSCTFPARQRYKTISLCF